MRKTVLLLAALLFAPHLAQAAGTVDLVSIDAVPGSGLTRYNYLLTADAADGSFPATTALTVNGWIVRVETNPGATAPTALWDLALVDPEGLDVMGGVLANRSATDTEHVLAPQPPVVGAVAITPTGNSVNDAVVELQITVLR